MWEVSAVSFKIELLRLDHYLYRLKPEGFDATGEQFDDLDASDRDSRSVKVAQAVTGLSLSPTRGVVGFSTGLAEERRGATYGLYRVMCGWSGMPGIPASTHALVQRIALPAEVDAALLDDAEYAVAWHYILTFAEYVKRAPVLPYLKPPNDE